MVISPNQGGGFGRKGGDKGKKKKKSGGGGSRRVGGAMSESRLRGWFGRKFWFTMVSLLFTFSIFGLGVVAYYAKDLPDISKLHNFEKSPGIRIYSSDGKMLASYGQVVGESLKYNEFPKELIAAVVATEDRRFFDHGGIDPIGVMRAMFHNVAAGGVVQGGSTITQQLAKNVFLTADRTLARKFQEVLLAYWLENHFTKQQIMELYLNRVYLGAGNYGVDAAAYHYFNKSARKLNLQESALLAGLLKAPSRYAPTRDPELAQKRTKQVLLNMEDADMISEKETALAISHIRSSLHLRQSDGGSYRYFTDWVVDQLPNYIGRVEGDMEVLTTFDPRLQAKAQAALDKVMKAQGVAMKASQASLLSMQPDGAIRALIGGVDYAKSQYNRAIQAKRQPGSSFKLLVYLAALEQGYTPETMVSDRPVTIGNWSPKNYKDEYRGEIPMRDAFAQSINTVAAIITHAVGAQRVVEMSRRLGISSKLLATPSIALGTNDVTMMEMTRAYAHVASGGRKVEPFAIAEIRSKDGRLLYRYRSSGQPQVIPGFVGRGMDSLLTAVVQYGTARKAQIGRPVAGKTGTTQDYRDAWFLGFTPQLVTGVWVGNDDYSPMKKVTGGSLPAEIWAGYMREAMAGLPPLPITQNITAEAVAGRVYTEDAGEVGPQPALPVAVESETLPPAPVAAQQPPAEMQPQPQPAGVFDWYDQDLKQGKKAEEPAKDDTLLDKLFEELQEGEVRYDYPGDKRRK